MPGSQLRLAAVQARFDRIKPTNRVLGKNHCEKNYHVMAGKRKAAGQALAVQQLVSANEGRRERRMAHPSRTNPRRVGNPHYILMYNKT
jgi:hypothetical protein